MFGSVHAVAQAATQVPAYCTSGTGVRTPAEWQTCAKLGWSQPVNGAANAGAAVGHYAAPVIAIVVIILLLVAVSRAGGSRRPATSK